MNISDNPCESISNTCNAVTRKWKSDTASYSPLKAPDNPPEDLLEKLNILVNYWLAMDAIIGYIHRRAAKVRIESMLRIKIGGLAENWHQVKTEDFDYKRKVSAIGAHFLS